MTDALRELQLPPYAQSLDMTIDGLMDGSPLIEMPFAQKVQGRPGFLHGGAISGLLEMAAVAAIAHALRERNDDARFKQVNVTVVAGATQAPWWTTPVDSAYWYLEIISRLPSPWPEGDRDSSLRPRG